MKVGAIDPHHRELQANTGSAEIRVTLLQSSTARRPRQPGTRFSCLSWHVTLGTCHIFFSPSVHMLTMNLAVRRIKASRLRAADGTSATNKSLNVSGRRVKAVWSITNVWRTRAHRKKRKNKTVKIIQKSRMTLKQIQDDQ